MDYPKKRPAIMLLVGGLIINIIISVLFYIIFLIIIAYAAALEAGLAEAIEGLSSGDLTIMKLLNSPEVGVAIKFIIVLMFIVIIYASLSIPLAILAIVFASVAKNEKMITLSGVLAMICAIPSILIPMELIGAIFLLQVEKEEQPKRRRII